MNIEISSCFDHMHGKIMEDILLNELGPSCLWAAGKTQLGFNSTLQRGRISLQKGQVRLLNKSSMVHEDNKNANTPLCFSLFPCLTYFCKNVIKEEI